MRDTLHSLPECEWVVIVHYQCYFHPPRLLYGLVQRWKFNRKAGVAGAYDLTLVSLWMFKDYSGIPLQVWSFYRYDWRHLIIQDYLRCDPCYQRPWYYPHNVVHFLTLDLGNKQLWVNHSHWELLVPLEDSRWNFTLEVLIIPSSPENSLVGPVLAYYDAWKVSGIIHVLRHEDTELSGFSAVWQHIVRCHTPHSQIWEKLNCLHEGQWIA